jgi:hypothetical protein
LIIEISHRNIRKKKTIAFAMKSILLLMVTISEKHPDYDVLAPILMNLKLKARKLILQNYTDIEKCMKSYLQLIFANWVYRLC